MSPQYHDRRFFGGNARAISEVELRRHPLAMSLYAVVCLLGLIFIFHWYTHGRSDQSLFPGVSAWAIFTWKWMMVLGGALGVTTLLVNPRPSPHWPDLADLLHLEGIAAGVCALGFTVYLVVVVGLVGWEAGIQPIGLYGLLIAGLLWRMKDALMDASRLQVLAQVSEDLEEARDVERSD